MKSDTKLKNENGASIILALIFFLICTTVGLSVFAAARANSGRLIIQKKTEQAYLTVRSAAMLVTDTIKQSDEPICVHTVTETTYSDGSISTDESWSKKYESSDASLNHKIYDSIYSILIGTVPSDTFKISVQSDGVEDVLCDITVSENDNTYSLDSALRLKDGSEYNYIMSMSMTGNISSSETVTQYEYGDSTVKQTDTLYTIKWIDVNYKNG